MCVWSLILNLKLWTCCKLFLRVFFLFVGFFHWKVMQLFSVYQSNVVHPKWVFVIKGKLFLITDGIFVLVLVFMLCLFCFFSTFGFPWYIRCMLRTVNVACIYIYSTQHSRWAFWEIYLFILNSTNAVLINFLTIYN